MWQSLSNEIDVEATMTMRGEVHDVIRLCAVGRHRWQAEQAA